MLDDINVLRQRDPSDSLGLVANLYQDLSWLAELASPEHDDREIKNVIIAGMGGSSLAADMLKSLLADEFNKPLEVIKGYDLPAYADFNTLVIASSHSGNTEETLSCYAQARQRHCQVAALTTGGELGLLAANDDVVRVMVPYEGQPRMAMIKHLRALLKLLSHFNLIDTRAADNMERAKTWLASETIQWNHGVPMHENYAKQLALLAVGKTPVFYGGPITGSLAYKWKISWNETAKNVAYSNQYPEFNHNEFIGWSSHPVDKPFAIFDFISAYEPSRIEERMRLSDKLLSGLRPKAVQIHLKGETPLEEMLWGCILADFASIYVAVLNGVNPAQVELVERLKKELS